MRGPRELEYVEDDMSLEEGRSLTRWTTFLACCQLVLPMAGEGSYLIRCPMSAPSSVLLLLLLLLLLQLLQEETTSVKCDLEYFLVTWSLT